MKVLIFILILVMTGMAQQDPVMGHKILFGSTFVTTDSARLRTSGLTDTLMVDTLYSGALNLYGEQVGIYGVAAYFTEVSGTSASMALDVRFGCYFTDPTDNRTQNLQWSDWQNILTSAKNTLTRMGIAADDSSWWNPAADVRQYRLREADADTVFHYITDYIK